AGEVEPWLADLYRLHELRWRSAGRAGSFADPQRRAFYRELVRGSLERGELRFARLVEGDAVVATQLGMQIGARYYQVQEGFDPPREDVRVGTALRALALGELIAAGVREYDFMAGDGVHKRDWGGSSRPCVTLAFPLERWRPQLAYALRNRIDRWRSA